VLNRAAVVRFQVATGEVVMSSSADAYTITVNDASGVYACVFVCVYAHACACMRVSVCLSTRLHTHTIIINHSSPSSSTPPQSHSKAVSSLSPPPPPPPNPMQLPRENRKGFWVLGGRHRLARGGARVRGGGGGETRARLLLATNSFSRRWRPANSTFFYLHPRTCRGTPLTSKPVSCFK